MDLPKLLAITDYQGIQKRFEQTRERLQKKVSRFSGELIVAVSRDYEPCSMSPHEPPNSYSVNSLLEAGVMGDKTVFGDLTEPKLGNLLSGLEKAFLLTDNGFVKREPAQFQGAHYKGLLLLADMDEPPEIPTINFSQYEKPFELPRIPYGPMIHETKDSRLELYIGNSMAIPYLRGLELGEIELEHLSKELGVKFD